MKTYNEESLFNEFFGQISPDGSRVYNRVTVAFEFRVLVVFLQLELE